MNRDVESLLAESFRDRAPVEVVDTTALIGRVRTRGRSLARRRRVVTGAAFAAVAVVLTAAVGVGAALIPARFTRNEAGAPPEPPANQVYSAPALPVAAGVPGAAGQPELVGRDPSVLHFSIEGATSVFAGAVWTTRPGLELVQLSRTPDTFSWVTVSTDFPTLDREVRERTGTYADAGTSAVVKVAGNSGTLRTIPTDQGVSHLVRWQTDNGLWIDVHVRAGEAEDLWSLVDRIRLDTAYRCGSPIGTTGLPAALRLTECSVDLTGYEELSPLAGTTMPRFRLSNLRYGDGKGAAVHIQTVAVPPGARRDEPTDQTIAGRAARFDKAADQSDDGEVIEALTLPDVEGLAVKISTPGPYGQKEATVIAEKLVVAAEIDRPESWPTTPTR